MAKALVSPSPKRLRAWRLYSESAAALNDLLAAELEREVGIPLGWFDALSHLEERPEGMRMNELAGRILYSTSGFTRVVDKLEAAELVRRVRPQQDRRSIFIVLTKRGRTTLEKARRHHQHAIEQHFSRHLADRDVKALIRALEKVGAHDVHSNRRPQPAVRAGRAYGRTSK